jgi:heat shock protein HspQ
MNSVVRILDKQEVRDIISKLDLGQDDPDVIEDGGIYSRVVGIEIDPEWAKTQEWYHTVYCGINDIDYEELGYEDWDEFRHNHLILEPDKLPDPPKYIIRVMELSNTGYNLIIGEYPNSEPYMWYYEWLGGNAPGWQGCYEYSGGYDENDESVGVMVNTTEALEWVDELYTDHEDVWV